MKKNQREEIETVRSEYEEEIRMIKETHQDQENVYKNQIESKTLLVQYVMKVLQDTDELIDNWQNTVKEQAHEINESNRKINESRKLEEMAWESFKTIKTQEEAIDQLEQIVANNDDLSESYRKLAENDMTKTNFNNLILTLTKQENQLETLSEYFKNKNELMEQVMTIEKLMDNYYNLTKSEERADLLSNYHKLLDKQSTSISLLRTLLISKDNSSAGLNYEKDNDGHIISVTLCSCLPRPPHYTGLELRSVVMECGEDNSSNYVLECGGGECTTDTWPVCDDDTTEEILENSPDTTWEYTACQEVDIDYLNKTVSCGKDGWKTGKVVAMVGQGVFSNVSGHVPCLDCHQEMFQWTPWESLGKRHSRTRGSAAILESLQTEERGKKITFLLVSLHLGLFPIADCPSDWLEFSKNCYKGFLKYLNWVDAESHCIEHGGHLASVHSDQEKDFIHGLVPSLQFWIGGNGMMTENEWVWSDGSKFSYSPWHSRQPDNWDNKEHCM